MADKAEKNTKLQMRLASKIKDKKKLEEALKSLSSIKNRHKSK